MNENRLKKLEEKVLRKRKENTVKTEKRKAELAQIEDDNLKYFQEELELLKSSNNGMNPVLIALGNDVYNLLNKYITGYTIKNVRHYAGYFSDVWYKQHFVDTLSDI